MRLVVVLVLVAAGCKPNWERMCRYDCRQARACAAELEVDPPATVAECTANCVSLIRGHGAAGGAAYSKGYGRCGGLVGCDYVACTAGQPCSRDWAFEAEGE